jgi:GAF domain-containing protein
MSREGLVAQTLVDLAETLVDEFDVVDLLTLLADRCVAVFDVAAAGVMLVSPAGELRVVASSSDKMHVLELFEEQSEEGPCPDCYRTGMPVINESLSAKMDRWPHFAPQAIAAGFASVSAVPMHLRDSTIGALNLFRSAEGALRDDDVHTAQAFADVATIAILQQGGMSDTRAIQENVQRVLSDRALIEQAKGVLSERHSIEMHDAFNQLRAQAHENQRSLVETAQKVIDGTLPATSVDR